MGTSWIHVQIFELTYFSTMLAIGSFLMFAIIKGRSNIRNYGTREAAEAQKPSWHRGIAIRKVFARLESFCA